ncbi:hypothetical protein [Paraburkholderia diazotrophica]|uniref:hypothetical protein n=1 Tax=Paraburkholderia diazotrophica TaxID=667676 RepID=UPI003179ECA8
MNISKRSRRNNDDAIDKGKVRELRKVVERSHDIVWQAIKEIESAPVTDPQLLDDATSLFMDIRWDNEPRSLYRKAPEVGMASHLLSHFPQDEQDDFLAVCQKYGRAVSEFEVVDEDQYPGGGRVGPIGRQVTVALRGKSSVALYDRGHGSA